ncbi:uncharacterized protein VP01_319g3 [Puccinia sorghi]|uniref:Uncharacterized protein n=1 Tax=Puccinia sorghi TaxID=27349 RepID=A0A0L6UZ98_9BASI|nr:uncharacterized protein VP01_319g3 [Puccinia sorghi]
MPKHVTPLTGLRPACCGWLQPLQFSPFLHNGIGDLDVLSLSKLQGNCRCSEDPKSVLDLLYSCFNLSPNHFYVLAKKLIQNCTQHSYIDWGTLRNTFLDIFCFIPRFFMLIHLSCYLLPADSKYQEILGFCCLGEIFTNIKSSFIQEEINSTFDPVTVFLDFKVESQHFDQSAARCFEAQPQAKNNTSSILSKNFEPDQPTNNLESKLFPYLWSNNESPKHVLCYISIPTTSAPSECVFSSSKSIHLLCLGEWYQLIGTLDPTPFDENKGKTWLVPNHPVDNSQHNFQPVWSGILSQKLLPRSKKPNLCRGTRCYGLVYTCTGRGKPTSIVKLWKENLSVGDREFFSIVFSRHSLSPFFSGPALSPELLYPHSSPDTPPRYLNSLRSHTLPSLISTHCNTTPASASNLKPPCCANSAPITGCLIAFWLGSTLCLIRMTQHMKDTAATEGRKQ